MCSHLAQIAYGLITVAMIALTGGALYRNEWVVLPEVDVSDPAGLWCNGDVKECAKYFKDLKTFQKVVLAGMILAVVAEIAALVYNIFTFFACYCKQYLLHPLSALSTLIAVFLGVAVAVYCANSEEQLEILEKYWNEQKNTKFEHTVDSLGNGTSLILTAVAFGLAVVNTIIASLAICFADHLI